MSPLISASRFWRDPFLVYMLGPCGAAGVPTQPQQRRSVPRSTMAARPFHSDGRRSSRLCVLVAATVHRLSSAQTEFLRDQLKARIQTHQSQGKTLCVNDASSQRGGEASRPAQRDGPQQRECEAVETVRPPSPNLFDASLWRSARPFAFVCAWDHATG